MPAPRIDLPVTPDFYVALNLLARAQPETELEAFPADEANRMVSVASWGLTQLRPALIGDEVLIGDSTTKYLVAAVTQGPEVGRIAVLRTSSGKTTKALVGEELDDVAFADTGGAVLWVLPDEFAKIGQKYALEVEPEVVVPDPEPEPEPEPVPE